MLKYIVPVIALMIGSCWLGFIIAGIYISSFSYAPCWNSLSDVYYEAKHQEELGFDGWSFRNPNFLYGCERVDERWRYKGYKGQN